MKVRKKFKTVDEYISSLGEPGQSYAQQMREEIRKAAPEAEEVISYNMPAYRLGGMLVWFAIHSHHLGFYPRVSAQVAFEEELKSYKRSKGTVQFPFDKKLPLALIRKMVLFRVKENREADALKALKGKGRAS